MKTLQRIDELIDAHGGILAAIANRQEVIARRSAQGKMSLNAEAELAALKRLPLDYRTAADQARSQLPPDYIS